MTNGLAPQATAYVSKDLGVEGWQKSREKTKARFPLLVDAKSQTTRDYSRGGFHTYIIDEEGVVRSVLTGAKTKRPTAKAILAALDKSPKKPADPTKNE